MCLAAPQEEAKDAFKELLASVGVASNWEWETAMRLIIGDPRCACAPIGLIQGCRGSPSW